MAARAPVTAEVALRCMPTTNTQGPGRRSSSVEVVSVAPIVTSESDPPESGLRAGRRPGGR